MSNFSEVLNAQGQLIPMFATVLEVGMSKLSQKQKPYQSAKLRDDIGGEHTVTIHKGTDSLLDSSCLNQRLQFAMQTYQSQRGAAFSGFWNSTAQVVPSQPPQTAPVAPQSLDTPAPIPSDPNMQTVRIEALHAILDAVDIPLGQVQNYLLTSVQFILTGNWNLGTKKYQGSEQPTAADGRPIDDDIPF